MDILSTLADFVSSYPMLWQIGNLFLESIIISGKIFWKFLSHLLGGLPANGDDDDDVRGAHLRAMRGWIYSKRLRRGRIVCNKENSMLGFLAKDSLGLSTYVRIFVGGGITVVVLYSIVHHRFYSSLRSAGLKWARRSSRSRVMRNDIKKVVGLLNSKRNSLNATDTVTSRTISQ